MGEDINVEITESTPIDVSASGGHTRYGDDEAVAAAEAAGLSMDAPIDMGSYDLISGNNTIYDSTAGHVPASIVEDIWLEDSADSVGRDNILPSFYTQTEADSTFVDASGDTVNGDLNIGSNITITETGNVTGVQFYTGSALRIASWQTDSSGSGQNVVRDRANSQDIAQFHEGGDVHIPNGVLNMRGNMIDNLTNIRQSPGDNLIINLKGTTSTDRFTVYDNGGGLQVLSAYQGGDVEAPNGHLITGESLRAGANMRLGQNSADPYIQFKQNDESNWLIRDFGNQLSMYKYTTDGVMKVLELLESGQVTVRNGDFVVDGGDTILRGNLHMDVAGNFIKLDADDGSRNIIRINNTSTGVNTWELRHINGSDLSWRDDGNNEHFTLRQNGNVEVRRGNLVVGSPNAITKGVTIEMDQQYSIGNGAVQFKRDSSSNAVVDGYSGVILHDGQNNIDLLKAESGGDVNIPNGGLSIMGTRLYMQSTEPTDATSGDIWIDTS